MQQANAKPLRAGVIGTGYFGRFHAQKYLQLPHIELVAVADKDPESVNNLARQYAIQGCTHYHALLDQVDLVSIATPAHTHYNIAKDCIWAGCHVLIEKPMTTLLHQAEELVDLARENQVVVQVGHLERFNPVFRQIPVHLQTPAAIECHRLTPFQQRGNDVSVVLDLMIHDIDLVHQLIPGKLVSVEARGLRLYSETPDLVNAVLRFQSGQVANLTASRISRQGERAMHLFDEHHYTCLDLQASTISVEPRPNQSGRHWHRQVPRLDMLANEVADFVAAVEYGSAGRICGQQGVLALTTASRIMAALGLAEPEPEPVPEPLVASWPDRIAYERHPETAEPLFARRSWLKTLTH